MKLLVSSKKITLTEAIEKYTDKKLQTVEKFFKNIIKAEVILGLESHHHLKGDIFFAECKLSVPSMELFAKAVGKDVYQAIDALKDELASEIKRYKQKLKGNEKKKKTVARENKEYNTEVEPEEML
jgi:ribosomal subunit interface protein